MPVGRLLLLLLACELAQAEKISGVVVDAATGAPLPQAVVSIKGRPAVQAGGTGRFTTPELEPGTHRLEIFRPGYATVIYEVRAEPNTNFVAQLLPHGSIAGEVLDEQSRPVPGIAVRAFRKRRGAEILEQAGKDVLTDDGGGYRFDDLAPGEYVVLARYDHAAAGIGFAFYPAGTRSDRARTFPIAGGEQYIENDFVIRPEALYTISGSVRGAEDDTKGVLVTLVHAELPGVVLGTYGVDSNGAFEFEGVPSGTYDLVSTVRRFVAGDSPTPRYGRMRVEITGASQDHVTMALGAGSSAELILKVQGDEPGRCPRRVDAAIRPLAAGPGSDYGGSTSVNRSAPSRIGPVRPESHTISVTGLGEDCYWRGVEADGAAIPEPVVDLSPGSRRIAIVLSSEFAAARGRTSAPAGYAVALFFDGDAFGAPMPVGIQFPDAQGRFSFEQLRPGRYRLAAVPPVPEPGRPWFRNTEKMAAFTLRPGQTATLQVKQ